MATNTPNVAPFPINPVQTGITLAYKNLTLIADSVMPRVNVATKEFKYQKYDKAERFTVPNTLVGRKGAPKLNGIWRNRRCLFCEGLRLR